MCGIAGIYNLKSFDRAQDRQIDEDASSLKELKKMTDAISYRGPDDEGFFVDEKIAVGHRRLSILDLTAAGHQPMFFDSDNLVLVFNGEIYNYIEIRQELIQKGYKFKSKTDSEVILASYMEWGEKCLDKFNGMWAFVIYDRKYDLLFASRDRFGVKPFYYYIDDDNFIFASEIKSILTHPSIKTKPNDKIIHDYLINGLIDHTEETFFEGIFELRGGHSLTIQNSEFRIKNYWKLKSDKIELKKPEEEQIKEFRDLFLDAVKLRLRSDVAIGTCLSGGLDSSAIACAVNGFLKKEGKMAQIGDLQKTFSAVYDPKKYVGCDERPFIEEVIGQTRADSHYVFPSGQNLAKEIDEIVYHHDAPVISTSIYAQWNVFRLAKENNVKVMLDGQGADEYLAGYLTFFPYLFKSLWHEKKYGALAQETFDFLRFHGHQAFYNFFKSFGRFPLIKSLQKKTWPNLKSLYQGSYFDYSIIDQAWQEQFKIDSAKNISDSIQSFSRSLLFGNGLPALLRYEDRDSMAFSIESRTPFLDYRLVEFVYSLENNQKIRHGQTKWIMRQALKDLLPAKILNRQDKIGFNTPEEIWFKNELAPQIKKTFRSKIFSERPYFDAPKIIKAFDQFIEGEPISYQLFWRIYNLELWLERYF